MSFTQNIQQSSALTPAELERRKTAQQRAEDFMYTMNHAITCLSITDLLVAPFFASVFGWNICNHDHEHGHDHHDHHHEHVHVERTAPPQTRWEKTKGWLGNRLKLNPAALKEWFIGEFAGDVGAVPVTLAVQRYAPGVMTGIQHMLEPVVGGILHRRAETAAEHWAAKHNIAPNSQQVVDRAEDLYRYEIRHLPQMAMWTLSSIGINYGVMRWRNEHLALGTFAKGKAAGAGITAALVLGARTFAPGKAHEWDETMGRRVVVPVANHVGRLFGVDTKDVEKNDNAPKEWKERVARSESPEQAFSV